MEKMRVCSVVVFDMDDTIFEEATFVYSGFRAVDSWLVAKQGRSGFFGIAKELFESGHRGTIFDSSLAQLAIPNVNGLIFELVKVYREHAPVLQLYPDADWALREFRGHYRLGIITDGYLVTQKAKVSSLGLKDRVDSIIYSDAYGRDNWKPSPTPYCKLVESLGCEHSECIYVSDNPRKDFVTARKLGWRTVQIQRERGEYRDVEVPCEFLADRVITTLLDLPELIQNL